MISSKGNIASNKRSYLDGVYLFGTKETNYENINLAEADSSEINISNKMINLDDINWSEFDNRRVKFEEIDLSGIKLMSHERININEADCSDIVDLTSNEGFSLEEMNLFHDDIINLREADSPKTNDFNNKKVDEEEIDLFEVNITNKEQNNSDKIEASKINIISNEKVNLKGINFSLVCQRSSLITECKPDVHLFDDDDIDRINRLLKEAFELAFLLCIGSEKKFGPQKLLYLISEIIPTGYVLNTSYWPKYKQTTRSPDLCVCKWFQLRCRHIFNYESVLDNINIEENIYWRSNASDIIYLKNLEIKIIQCKTKMLTPEDYFNQFLRVTMNVEVIVEKIFRESRLANFRFEMHPIKSTSSFENRCFTLDPHPIHLEEYGSVIKDLLCQLNMDPKCIPELYYVNAKYSPKFAVICKKMYVKTKCRGLIINIPVKDGYGTKYIK